MKPSRQALNLAIDLAERPALSGILRRQPLPADILVLVKIASGCDDLCRRAARTCKRDPDFVREAAILYLQSVMLSPEADAYRVLGASPNAPQEQLRDHLRWLMKWLHPDRTVSDWESVFARRVLDAWQQVKSKERRARYDKEMARFANSSNTGKRRKTAGGARAARTKTFMPWITAMPATPGRTGARVAKGVALAAVVALGVILTIYLPGREPATISHEAEQPDVSIALPR